MAYSKIRGPKKKKKSDGKEQNLAKDAFQSEGRRFFDKLLEHPMFIVGTVAAIIIVVFLSIFISNHIEKANNEKADIFAEALDTWSASAGEAPDAEYSSEHERLKNVIKKFSTVKKKLSGTVYAKTSDMFIGKAHYLLNEYGKAIDHFKKMQGKQGLSEELKFGAYEGEAFCYFDRKEYTEAISVWDRYLSSTDSELYKDYAMYYTAQAYEKSGERKKSVFYYKKLKEDYPDSSLAMKIQHKIPEDEVSPEEADS